MMIEKLVYPLIVGVFTGVISAVVSLILITRTEKFKSKLKRSEFQFQIDYEQWAIARKKSSEYCYRILNTLKLLKCKQHDEYLEKLKELFNELREHLYETVDTLKINSAFLKLHEFKNTFENILDTLVSNQSLDWDSRFDICICKIDKLEQLYNSWRDQIGFQSEELHR